MGDRWKIVLPAEEDKIHPSRQFSAMETPRNECAISCGDKSGISSRASGVLGIFRRKRTPLIWVLKISFLLPSAQGETPTGAATRDPHLCTWVPPAGTLGGCRDHGLGTPGDIPCVPCGSGASLEVTVGKGRGQTLGWGCLRGTGRAGSSPCPSLDSPLSLEEKPRLGQLLLSLPAAHPGSLTEQKSSVPPNIPISGTFSYTAPFPPRFSPPAAPTLSPKWLLAQSPPESATNRGRGGHQNAAVAALSCTELLLWTGFSAHD